MESKAKLFLPAIRGVRDRGRKTEREREIGTLSHVRWSFRQLAGKLSSREGQKYNLHFQKG